MGYLTKPNVREHEVFHAPLRQGLDEARVEPALVATASREAAAREDAYVRALNTGGTLRVRALELRQPRLADDFAQQVAQLDATIYERGVALSRSKLVSLGKLRFQQLLAADRAARTEQRVIGVCCDLTSWPSVLHAFIQGGALQHVPVPERSMVEQLSGTNAELDAVRDADGFADLWKFSASEPRAIRAVYVFRDIFEALVFGQSLLTWLDDDDRVHHKFFAGRAADKARLFEAWLPALKGPPHYRVKITNALQAMLFWLSRETSAAPSARDLARDWFGVRAPSREQITAAQAAFDGWLLNCKGWELWQFVGRRTRTLPDQNLLQDRCEALTRAFPMIAVFHRDAAACFYRAVGDHHEFEAHRYRDFIDGLVVELHDCVSALVALTIEENSPRDSAVVAARFRDWILCSGEAKAQLVERIEAKLANAFARAAFRVEIE